jgi:DNA-binding MarR family transcriptional regulator
MHPDPSPLTGLESGIGFRLGRAHRRLRSAWESQIADLGLTSAQGAVVRAVAECPGSGLRELARRLHADPMNVKRMADCLERAGLVLSSSDPADRRRRVLQPTPRGAAVGAQLAERARDWSAQVEQLLGPSDLETLQSLLDRLESGLAAYPPAASTRGHRQAPSPSCGAGGEEHLVPARPGANHE